MKEEFKLSTEEQKLFSNFYNLTRENKEDIKYRRKALGMTIEEIARRYEITPPDVNRILSPPKNYGSWTPEEKLRHWMAGKKRAETVKKQREDGKN